MQGFWRRLRTHLQSHQDFYLLLGLFTTFRALALYQFRPGGFVRDYSHIDVYPGIAALSDYGLYPFLDFWLEWPPPMPWLLVGIYKLTLYIPVWEDPRLWYSLLLGGIFLLFEVGNFAVLYRLAGRLYGATPQRTRVLWFYAALFSPVIWMMSFFDGLTLFFMLLSLDLLLARRHNWAAAAAGLGFAIKLVPVLAMAPLARRLWSDVAQRLAAARFNTGVVRATLATWVRVSLVFSGVVLLVVGPFILIAPEWMSAFLRALGGRSSWETVWAVLEGYYSFGAVGGDRLNPAESNFAIHSGGNLPWLWISLAFAAFYLWLFQRPADYTPPKTTVAFLGLTSALFMVYSRGYSPQFLVYLLPFIVLLLPNFTGLGYIVLLEILNVLEQPTFFVILPDAHWLLTAVVSLRMAVWLGLGLEFGRLIWPGRMEAWARLGRLGLAGVSVLGLLAFIPLGWQAYVDTRLSRHSQQEVIRFLQSQATSEAAIFILSEQSLYQQLHPYLYQNYDLVLAGGDTQFRDASSALALLPPEDNVWLLATGPEGTRVATEITSQRPAARDYRLPNQGTIQHLAAAPRPPQAQAQNGIALQSYQLEPGPVNTLQLYLFWHNRGPVVGDYTVFVQLLAPDGRLGYGQDSPPQAGRNPTSTWTPDELIVDHHELQLPPDLPPGSYRLVVGMYAADGQRLSFARPEGTPWPNQAIDLTEVEIP